MNERDLTRRPKAPASLYRVDADGRTTLAPAPAVVERFVVVDEGRTRLGLSDPYVVHDTLTGELVEFFYLADARAFADAGNKARRSAR